MNKIAKSILKIFMFLAIGVTILYIVYLKNNAQFLEECMAGGKAEVDCDFIAKIMTDIGSADYLWVIIALAFFLLSNVSRAYRWGMMLEPLGHRPRFVNTFCTVMINYLANLGIPRSGEFVRAGLLAKYEGFEVEKVMGTIVTSRLLDVICLLITISLTLLLSFDNFVGYFRASDLFGSGDGSLITPTLLIGLAAFGVVALGILWKYRTALLQTKIGAKVWEILVGFWEGILTVRNLKSPVWFVFHTAVIWICYYLMTYLMFFSFAPTADLAPVAGLVVFVFGTLGIVIPSPGGMGTYQFLISEGLTLYAIPFAEAFSFANIMFFSVQLCNIALGIAAFFILPIVNRNE